MGTWFPFSLHMGFGHHQAAKPGIFPHTEHLGMSSYMKEIKRKESALGSCGHVLEVPGMALEYLPEMQGFPHFKHPTYETAKQHPSPAPSSLFHEAASDKETETCTETMRMVGGS